MAILHIKCHAPRLLIAAPFAHAKNTTLSRQVATTECFDPRLWQRQIVPARDDFASVLLFLFAPVSLPQSAKSSSRYSPGLSEFTAVEIFPVCFWIFGQLVVGKPRWPAPVREDSVDTANSGRW
jgi:hypothetical protein